jgi:hypothetical protein
MSSSLFGGPPPIDFVKATQDAALFGYRLGLAIRAKLKPEPAPKRGLSSEEAEKIHAAIFSVDAVSLSDIATQALAKCQGFGAVPVALPPVPLAPAAAAPAPVPPAPAAAPVPVGDLRASLLSIVQPIATDVEELRSTQETQAAKLDDIHRRLTRAEKRIARHAPDVPDGRALMSALVREGVPLAEAERVVAALADRKDEPLSVLLPVARAMLRK